MYSCSCTGPKFQLWRIETRIARKNYNCFECKDPIRKGTPHKYIVGQWNDNHISSVRLCIHCDADWGTIMDIEEWLGNVHSLDDWMCFGTLGNRVLHAVEKRWIDENHPLVQQWGQEDLLRCELVGKTNPLQLSLPLPI